EELRITGGEPLVRKSFEEISGRFAALPLKKIGLTTNAVLLSRYLPVLKRNRVHHLNISLDSLDAETFRKITNGNRLPAVLEGIERAVAEGFHVKINVVAMRGINDHEFPDFVEFSKRLGVEVRFLELMRIGFALRDQASQFISAGEILSSLQPRYTLRRQSREKDSTSFNYVTECGAEVGFIASESQAFCGQCSRWRLSADGILRACLLKDDGLSVRGTTRDERADIYDRVLGMKPFMRPKEVTHQMNGIGG
ncbi:MAG: radical SAM protein, partial [Proteobacteria bacterium]